MQTKYTDKRHFEQFLLINLKDCRKLEAGKFSIVSKLIIVPICKGTQFFHSKSEQDFCLPQVGR